MPSLIIRPMTPADIDEISALARKIWQEHYVTIISQAQIEYMLEQMYSKDSLQQQMAQGQRFYLAEQDKILMGYASLENSGGGDYFLHKFYIDTTRQRQGIGAKLLTHIERAHSDMLTLRLKVNRANVLAINFYFKNGFTIEYVKDFDIGSGFFMNDFVMVKKVRH